MRLPHAAPSLEVESSPSETRPSALTAPGASGTSYQFPALTAPNSASLAPSMAGRVFQVIDSSHELELMENTRPPVLDASRWYMRRRTARTWRPAIPATRKRTKDWLCGLVSTSNCEDVPKLVVGAWRRPTCRPRV